MKECRLLRGESWSPDPSFDISIDISRFPSDTDRSGSPRVDTAGTTSSHGEACSTDSTGAPASLRIVRSQCVANCLAVDPGNLPGVRSAFNELDLTASSHAFLRLTDTERECGGEPDGLLTVGLDFPNRVHRHVCSLVVSNSLRTRSGVVS